MPRVKQDNCSFCGRSRAEVTLLISGLNGFICNECVEQAQLILDEHLSRSKNDMSGMTLEALPKPQEIKEFLDGYVIGQDDAKKALCVAVYNH